MIYRLLRWLIVAALTGLIAYLLFSPDELGAAEATPLPDTSATTTRR